MSVIWHEVNGIGISNGAPKGPIVLYYGTDSNWPTPPAPNAWHSLYLGGNDAFGNPIGIPDPMTVRWVELAGLLIVTPGTNSLPTDELCLSFQTPDPSWGGNPANYFAQCTMQNQRDNMCCSVMAYNGTIDWAWCRGNPNTGTFPDKPVQPYPIGTDYAFNIAIQKYGR